MQSLTLPRKLGGQIALDVCGPCQGIWFDSRESLQLAPSGVVELFRLIHAQAPEVRRALAASCYCPRCGGRLERSADRVKGGPFNYLRCNEHGRFISFGQFLIEKGFVKEIPAAELKKLEPRVAMLRCSSCGAPVDIRKDSVCSHCHAPIVVLDAAAVDRALAEYGRPAAAIALTDTSRLSGAAPGHPAAQPGADHGALPAAVDLVGEGIAAICQAMME